MRALLDLHHLGRRQTGNETWARNICAPLLAAPGDDEYDIVVTDAARDIATAFPARHTERVSNSSALRLTWEMPRLLKALQSDVALVQYSVPLTTTPCVLAVHDLSFEDPRAPEWIPLAARVRYRATIRASVKRAAHVLALSAHTRDDLVRLYRMPPARISVVHAAVDRKLVGLLKATPRAPRSDKVLVVGNVLPRKNLLVVGRAISRLRTSGMDVQLVVIGSVPSGGKQIEAELRRLLAGAVSFSGYVDDRQLAIAYKSASLFAFPSLYEGFGLPVVEAMAAQLPVVCSDASCLPEVARGAALVVPAEDDAAWTEAIRRGLTDSALREDLTRRGVQRADQFSWERSAEAVRHILRSVAADPALES